MSDLLQEALTRHAYSVTTESDPSLSPRRGRFSPPSLASLSLADPDDDNDLIPVQTPFASRQSSPAPSHPPSRSASPTRSSSSSANSSSSLSRPRSGAGKPRRDKTLERGKEKANKESRDPLIRLPNELNALWLAELTRDDLLICGGVCKRWKSSQTINYTWYNLLQSITYTTPLPRAPKTTAASALLLWTRGNSKIDWAARFASIFRRDDLEDPDAGLRDEEGLTMKEERELKWASEEAEGEERKVDKVAMRAYYKSLGNAKVKGKTGKGSERTWEGDGNGEAV